MAHVDPRVDDRDLDAVALRRRSSATRRPRLEGVHEPEVGVVVAERPVDGLELGTRNHRRRRDRAERRAVEPDTDRVQRDVELAGDLCARRIRPQPLLEVVPQRTELSAVVLDRGRTEVDLLAVAGLRPLGRRQRLALQHDKRATCVDGRRRRTAVGLAPHPCCCRSRKHRDRNQDAKRQKNSPLQHLSPFSYVPAPRRAKTLAQCPLGAGAR
jgi:hypothetical protein